VLLRVIIPLVLLSLAFAPAPLPRSPRAHRQRRDDLAALQGEWVAVWTMLNNNVKRREADYVVTIKGRTLSHLFGGQASATWAIDPDPRHAPPRLNQRSKTTVLLSIYRLEGDTLTLCWRNDLKDNTWPVDFYGGAGIGVTFYRRKR
jgi:uncharacterized protein (TIGR03067 family)